MQITQSNSITSGKTWEDVKFCKYYIFFKKVQTLILQILNIVIKHVTIPSDDFWTNIRDAFRTLDFVLHHISLYRYIRPTELKFRKASWIHGKQDYPSLHVIWKLIHLFPMHPFSTRWKHQKTLRFSDVFSG